MSEEAMRGAAQRGQERARVRAKWGYAQRVDGGLWRVRLENPHGHLMVNTYVWKESGFLAIVDPGWPWTVDALEVALRELELMRDWAEVDCFVYTHTHVDHMGAAVLFQRLAPRAEHICHRLVSPHLSAWHAFQDAENDWRWWVADAFAEPHRAALMAHVERDRAAGNAVQMVKLRGPGALEQVRTVRFGEVVTLGSLRLEVHDARGHDPTHIALREPERGWLFCGDAVLSVPTPISRAMADDLNMYRETLQRIGELDFSLMLPGHGSPARTPDRIAQLLERSRGYVDFYAKSVRRALAGRPRPWDLFELSLALSTDGAPMEPQSRWVVHMALVDSHLAALCAAGEVVRIDAPSGPTYTVA